jgi:hypothetical protein
MKLQLYYDTLLVGDITAPLLHQDIWIGQFHQVAAAQDGPLARRLCDFIAFCQEWHIRLQAGATCDASEFEQFSDLRSSGLWLIRNANGTAAQIEKAPVFINGEISWRLKTSERAA